MVSRACRFLHLSREQFFKEAVRARGSPQDKASGVEIYVDRYHRSREIPDFAISYLGFLKPELALKGFFT